MRFEGGTRYHASGLAEWMWVTTDGEVDNKWVDPHPIWYCSSGPGTNMAHGGARTHALPPAPSYPTQCTPAHRHSTAQKGSIYSWTPRTLCRSSPWSPTPCPFDPRTPLTHEPTHFWTPQDPVSLQPCMKPP